MSQDDDLRNKYHLELAAAFVPTASAPTDGS